MLPPVCAVRPGFASEQVQPRFVVQEHSTHPQVGSPVQPDTECQYLTEVYIRPMCALLQPHTMQSKRTIGLHNQYSEGKDHRPAGTVSQKGTLCRARSAEHAQRRTLCGARSAAHALRRMLCDTRSVAHALRRTLCGARSAAHALRRTLCGARSVTHALWHTLCGARSAACALRRTLCGARSAAHALRRMLCDTRSVAHALRRTLCGAHSVAFVCAVYAGSCKTQRKLYSQR